MNRTTKLNKIFYSRKAIEQGLNDFSEFLNGSIIDDKFTIEIILKTSEPFLIEEFCNYILALTKNELCNKPDQV